MTEEIGGEVVRGRCKPPHLYPLSRSSGREEPVKPLKVIGGPRPLPSTSG